MAEKLMPGDRVEHEVLHTEGANWFCGTGGTRICVQFKLVGGGLSPVYAIPPGAVGVMVARLQGAAEQCRKYKESQDGQG